MVQVSDHFVARFQRILVHFKCCENCTELNYMRNRFKSGRRGRVKKMFFHSREHLVGEDILFPDLSVRDSRLDPAMMDFLLLTQVVMVVMRSLTSLCSPRPTTPSMTTAALASGLPCWLVGQLCSPMVTGLKITENSRLNFSAARDRTRSLPRSGKSRRKVGRGSMLLMLMLINIINIVKVKGC